MVKLIAVGDIFLKTKFDEDPFKYIKTTFDQKDILFGNLEVVLSKKGKKADKFALIYTDPGKVKYLNNAKFDVLNIANNHILDRDYVGLKNTIDVLNQNNLNYIGINILSKNREVLLEKDGIIFGFLGYTDGIYELEDNIEISVINKENILNDVTTLKNKCDFVIVSLHWGIENVFYPSPKQITIAREIIDAGATLILGHHPHVIQGLEKYKNGLIAYSLGNFNFDTKLSKSKTDKSIILSVNLNRNGILDYKIDPIEINENYMPMFVKDEIKYNELELISRLSESVITNEITENWWFEQICGEYLSSNFDSFIQRIIKYGIKHFIELIFWLFSPFCIKCYFSLIRSRLK